MGSDVIKKLVSCASTKDLERHQNTFPNVKSFQLLYCQLFFDQYLKLSINPSFVFHMLSFVSVLILPKGIFRTISFARQF